MQSGDFLDKITKNPRADTIVKGGVLVNVYTGELYQADVAIMGERILAVGDVAELTHAGTKIIDATNYYLIPGFIDAHIHMECSKLSVTMFAKLVIPYGTTSVVSGLDQIYVVAGLNGVRDFLAEASRTPLKIFWGAPCKLPYTIPPSTVGYKFTSKEHLKSQKWKECVGLWETVKEFVLTADPEVKRAMKLAEKNRLPVMGCAPMAGGKPLQLYAAAGVRADHESYSAEEMLAKLRSGILPLIRESAVAHFLKENIQLITKYNISHDKFAFCTDDIYSAYVLEKGHLDHVVRMAVEEGVDPVKAIQMATINCAEIYRIDHLIGSICPGRFADILLAERLDKLKVRKVIANGVLVASDGNMTVDIRPPKRRPYLQHTIKCRKINSKDLLIRTRYTNVSVLSMQMSSDAPFVRKKREAVLKSMDGYLMPDVEQDVLYVSVVERYHKNGRKATAFVSGFGLKMGAIASSTSPDDNNIICIGADVDDMVYAINKIIENQGGQIVVNNRKIIEFLPLPIGGIVTDSEPEEVAEHEKKLDEAARELGCGLPSPFMYMIFLSITAIPDYAITDKGLVDCNSLKVISPLLGPAK